MLAVAVYTTRTSGVPTGVLVYAFVFDYVFRLVTIRTLYIGGAVVAFRQTLGLPESAWTVMGPLLALRTIIDLSARLRQPSRRVRPIPALSAGRP